MYRVGINSCNVRNASGKGLDLDELKIDVIELGFDDVPLLINGKINMSVIQRLKTLDVEYTIHVPTSDARDEKNRLDFGIRSRRNIKIMENVIKIAVLLDAKYITIHGGDVRDSYQEAFQNTKIQFKEISALAEDYSVTLCLENLEDNRVGAFHHELLSLLDPTMTVTLDIGHAFLVSQKYDIPLYEFFTTLRKYTTNIHLHDNMGISDVHMPLGEGRIDLNLVFDEIMRINPENVILEILNYQHTNSIVKSINMARMPKIVLQVR